MNQILKVRRCAQIFNKLTCMTSKYAYNSRTYYPYHLEMQLKQKTELCSLPYIYSYCQLREYAMRAQGKRPKSGKGKSMQLTDEEMADVIDITDYKQQLYQITENLKKDYIENVSIRSAASNIINVIVKVDNEEYPLNELAVISKKNQNLIAINMSDFPEAIKPAIQSIVDSGSGLNPQQDGTMIYVTVPKMTREHRETLSKNARTLFVKAKDQIRTIQNSFIRDAKSKTELSEDLVFNTSNQIKVMADNCSSDLEKMMKEKQKELLGDS